MSVIKLSGFSGEAPRISPRLLPDSSAQIAQSVRLEDGDLNPFRKPKVVEELAIDAQTIYRHMDEWLAWDTKVNAVPGPVAADRLYYTGDDAPKMLDDGDVYELALPGPTTALTATVATGSPSALAVTSLWCYTFVTAFGEESEPSAASNALLVSAGMTITLAGFEVVPADRNVTLQRIYRAQTGLSGNTEFFFITERATGTGNYTDDLTIDFNEPLPSVDWNTPPDTLAGLIALPNGGMAAFDGKDLYFCEPYHPHAWPQKYIMTMDYDITGLAAFGTTIVVGTSGTPYMVSGTSPETMVSEKLELNMPCINPSGMIDLGYSVAYPSHDGLVVVEGGTPRVVTQSLLTRDQWQRLNPDTMVCGQYNGRFFASYSYTDAMSATIEGTLIIDLTGQDPFLIRTSYKAEAFFYELTTGSLFMAFGSNIYEWDASGEMNDTLTYRSKVFVTPAPTNFGALMFEIDRNVNLDEVAAYDDALEDAITANALLFTTGTLDGALNMQAVNVYDINGDALEPLPLGPTTAVNVYADGVLVKTVSHAGRIVRLPAGKLSREWEIEVISNTRVIDVTMATTPQEMRGV